MELFSMGMFCIDEIHTESDSFANIVGGAGTYAVLGSAVLVPREQRRPVSFICDEGYDFPKEMHQEIESWGLGTIFRRDESRETTKAWNKFVGNEERLFKYLSPKKQIHAYDMPTQARNAKVVHLICSPQRASEFLIDLKKHDGSRQAYIWEPVPTECIPSQYANLRQVVEVYGVDILSPNSLEAASMVSLPEPRTQSDVEQLLADHYDFAPSMVVRCGAMGCFVRTPTVKKWYPAFYDNRPEKIVDPSGAGNAFMGGMGLAIARNLDWDHTIAFASVGSSFMIEQIGPPVYDSETDTWNKERGKDRIEAYLEKIRCENSR